MGFIGTSWRVFQGVTSLGGTERIRKHQERYRELWDQYSRIRSHIDEQNTEMVAAAEHVQKQVRIARRSLKRAARLLSQFNPGSGGPQTSSSVTDLIPNSKTLVPRQGASGDIDGALATAAGAAAGTAFAAGSWGIVQLLGHASTGTALAGLHGSAAANAGWAWFGGGSLASGGGGMAAGHLVLPGIGTAVAVAVSSVLSHKEANKLAKACDEIEGVNKKNREALTALHSQVAGLKVLEERLFAEHKLLSDTMSPICEQLLPFGILSHFWRIIRSWSSGSYFRAEELPTIQLLQTCVQRFLSQFS